MKESTKVRILTLLLKKGGYGYGPDSERSEGCFEEQLLEEGLLKTEPQENGTTWVTVTAKGCLRVGIDPCETCDHVDMEHEDAPWCRYNDFGVYPDIRPCPHHTCPSGLSRQGLNVTSVHQTDQATFVSVGNGQTGFAECGDEQWAVIPTEDDKWAVYYCRIGGKYNIERTGVPHPVAIFQDRHTASVVAAGHVLDRLPFESSDLS